MTEPGEIERETKQAMDDACRDILVQSLAEQLLALSDIYGEDTVAAAMKLYEEWI